MVAVGATLVGLALTGAPSVAAEPSSAQTSSIAPPRPAGSTPTEYSYDDTHPGQQPEGASPALWILVGTVAGLIAIAVIMLKSGQTRTPSPHPGPGSERRVDDQPSNEK